MWYELFIITAATSGVLTFLVYLLATRIPSQEDLLQIGLAVVDAKLKDFNLNPGPGGRPPEGMLDKLLAIPGVQSYIGNMLKNMGPGTGGFNIGP